MIKAVVGKTAPGEELKWESTSVEELAMLASTPDMFGGSRTFVLRGALYGDRGEEFLDVAEAFAESPHTFVFEEEKLLKHETETLTKLGAKIEITKAEKKEYRFDNFGVASALAAKNKKALWLGLMQSFRSGEKAEAVAGLLCWQARKMGDPKLSRVLTFMYHDSHRGVGELELLLERFALTL